MSGPVDDTAEQVNRLALVVGYSQRRRALAVRYGVLVMQPPTLTLIGRDHEPLFSAPANSVEAEAVGGTRVLLTAPGGEKYFINGLSAQETGRKKARELAERHDAFAAPPPGTGGGPSLPVGFGESFVRLAQYKRWQPFLLGALRSIGVRAEPAED